LSKLLLEDIGMTNGFSIAIDDGGSRFLACDERFAPMCRSSSSQPTPAPRSG